MVGLGLELAELPDWEAWGPSPGLGAGIWLILTAGAGPACFPLRGWGRGWGAARWSWEACHLGSECPHFTSSSGKSLCCAARGSSGSPAERGGAEGLPPDTRQERAG